MEMLVASLTPGTAEALRAWHAWFVANQRAVELADAVDRLAAETDNPDLPRRIVEVRRERLERRRQKEVAADRRAFEQYNRATEASDALPDATTRDAVIATVARDDEGMAEITGRINQ